MPESRKKKTKFEENSQSNKLRSRVKASFHSGKLSVDWNGQEYFSLC
jgi:hypothetical protein